VQRNNSEASSKREPDENFQRATINMRLIARVVTGLEDHGRLGRFVANAG